MRRVIHSSFGKAALLAVSILMFEKTNAQVGQSPWQVMNPKPTPIDFYAADFVNDNLGLMVGLGGGIARTVDGGATWQYCGWADVTTTSPTLSVTKPSFADVDFVSPTVAYICGDQYLLKSIDGGINWTSMANPYTGTNYSLNSISFVSPDTGYLAGTAIGGAVTSGTTTIAKTVDGGVTWIPYDMLPTLPYTRLGSGASLRYDSSRAKDIYRIRFLRQDLGYVSGARGLLWKFNGSTWKDYSVYNYSLGVDTSISSFHPGTYVQSQSFYAMTPVDDTTVVMGSFNNGFVLRMTTAGDTSVPVLDKSGLISNANIRNMIVTPGGQVMFAQLNRYFNSADSGKSWSRGDVYPTGSVNGGLDMLAIAATPSGKIFFSGQSGVVADSAASTWTRNYTHARPGMGINRIKVADDSHIAAAGGFGTLISSTDGGNTWNDFSNASDAATLVSYYAFSYPHPDTMYLSTSTGLVKVSYDHGATFDLIFQDAFVNPSGTTSNIVYGMDWLNGQKGWFGSYRGSGANASSVIFRTTDGGLTWDSCKTFPTGSTAPQFRNMAYVTDNVGYATTNKGTIYKTIDGGATWTVSYQDASATLNLPGISAVNENIVWIAGFSGRVLYTTNGGTTWKDAKGNLGNGILNGITAYDSAQAFVYSFGQALFTNNGGASWQVFSAPTRQTLTDGAFTSITPGCGQQVCNALFVGGNDGNVLKFGSDQVLPIKFSPLTGSAANDGNQLFWSAYEQSYLDHFEVEFSRNGRDFSKVSQDIQPTAIYGSNYTWKHANIAPGKAYYRVKAIEKNGRAIYTNTIVLTNRQAARWGYYVSNGNFNLNSIDAQAGRITVRIMNSAGQLVAAKEFMHAGGAFNDNLIMPSASKGVHFVQVTNNGTATTFSVLIP